MSMIGSVTSVPPTLTARLGKGAAYAKFLAIYEGESEPMPSDSGNGEEAVSLDVSA